MSLSQLLPKNEPKEKNPSDSFSYR